MGLGLVFLASAAGEDYDHLLKYWKTWENWLLQEDGNCEGTKMDKTQIAKDIRGAIKSVQLDTLRDLLEKNPGLIID